MVLDLGIHERTANEQRGWIAAPRRRLCDRLRLGRSRRPQLGARQTAPPGHQPLVLPDAEPARRLTVAARALVRMIRGCLVPGVPRIPACAWLAIGAVVPGPPVSLRRAAAAAFAARQVEARPWAARPTRTVPGHDEPAVGREGGGR